MRPTQARAMASEGCDLGAAEHDNGVVVAMVLRQGLAKEGAVGINLGADL